MKRYVHAVGAVIVRNDEVLCALRSEQQGHAGKWEFAGGSIEENESPPEAVVREVKEELGCDVEVHVALYFNVHEYEKSIVDLITYYCTLVGDKEPEALEHDELRWVKISELGELDWAEADIPTVALLQNLKEGELLKWNTL